MWLGLASQLLIAMLIQVSIITPAATFWSLQTEYQTVLSVSGRVIVASLVAFSISQVLDIVVYQKLKDWSQGRWLWLRSNSSTYLGQAIDSIVFVTIVFYGSDHNLSIIGGSVLVKVILSSMMTPVVYFIVLFTHWYLDFNTLAFKSEKISFPDAVVAGH